MSRQQQIVTLKHPGYSFTYQHLKANFNSRTSRMIKLIFQQQQGNDIEVAINRDFFVKQCGCEDLQKACEDEQQQITFKATNEIIRLLSKEQNKNILGKFIMYLACGQLQFKLKDLQLCFLLACMFRVRLFIHALIDQNIYFDLQNQQLMNSTFKQCFEISVDILSQDGRYNFITWIFKKYERTNLLRIGRQKFQNDISSLQSFVVEYANYKTSHNIFRDDDINELIDIHSSMGKPQDLAKQKVKKLIQWQNVSVQILDANKRGLKFTDEQIRKVLQKRLNKLTNSKEQNIDPEILELRQRRDKLKKQYQRLQTQIQSNKVKGNSNSNSNSNSNKYFQQKTQLKYKPEYVNNQQKMPPMNKNNIQQKQQQQQMDQQQALQIQCDKVLNFSKQIAPPKGKKQQPMIKQPPVYSPSINHGSSQLPHIEQNPNCLGQKSVTLACGCHVCYQCLKWRYIQKTQKYQDLQNPIFKKDDFKRYGIVCYNCSTLMAQSDANSFNNSK